MKHLIWILVVLMLILHHDFWYWDDPTLVFGFLPIGLFYHACLSLAAAAVWLIAVTFAWPKNLELDSDSDQRKPEQS